MSGRAPASRAALRVPAQPRPTRERMRLVAPWTHRVGASTAGLEHSAPAILTFRDAEFVPRFFAGVAASDHGWTARAWDRLRAWRDWAEPPRAMTRADGSPRYDPAAVARRSPLSGEVEDAGTDPVGDAETQADSHLPWLRKLYLPLHQHFHLVSVELACQRFDWPPVARDRLVEGGLVLRRLVPGSAASGPGHWQDWIVGKDGVGAWVSVADREMKTAAGALLDPAAVDPAAIGDAAVVANLRARLGLGGSAPLTLAAQRLAPVPIGTGLGGQRLGLFGYLPLASSDVEPGPDATDPATWARVIAEMADAARQGIEDELVSQQAALDPSLFDSLHALAEDLLPPAPASTAADRTTLDGAWADYNARGFTRAEGLGFVVVRAPASSATRDAAIEALIADTAAQARARLWDTVDRADPTSAPGTKPDYTVRFRPQTWWDDAFGHAVDLLLPASIAYNDDDGWLKWVVDHNLATFERLVRARAWSTFRRTVPPRPISGSGSAMPGWTPESRDRAWWVLLVLRRVRACRMALMDAVQRTVIDEAADRPDLLRTRSTDGAPLFTVASNSAELTAWLAADQDRDVVPRPWPTIPEGVTSAADPRHQAVFQDLVPVHLAAQALEDRLAALERVGVAAGQALVDTLDRHREDVRLLVESPAVMAGLHLGDGGLRQLGVSLDEQPVRGLLVHPTVHPAWQSLDDEGQPRTVLERLAADVEDTIRDLLPTGVDPVATPQDAALAPVRLALRDRAQARLPRFDPDSIYAAWCFVRVRGKDRCERPVLLWSHRTEPFTIAEPMDLLGMRPTTIRLPDLNKMLRDLPRIPRAGAAPVAAVITAADSGLATGEGPGDTERQWGIAWICSFAIPVFTICAWILFSIIFSILILLPGFFWMLLIKLCIPVPRRS